MKENLAARRDSSLLARSSFWLLTLLPFIYLAAVVVRYRLDFPYLDQWEFVPFLAKSYEGTLSFHDFWAQHNEHRLIFPRLLMLALARASRWNIAWELAANIVLALGLFVALIGQLHRTAKAMDAPQPKWLIPFVSLLVFSVSQWENWFLGWQLQEFLNVLAVVLGLILLSGASCRWPGFLGAVFFGIVATYSFANGILYWPIGLAILFVVRPSEQNAARLRIGLWLTVAALVAASYLYDYHAPDYHPSAWLLFRHPVEFGLYVLKYLGAPVANFSGAGAALAGLIGLAGLCVLTRRLVRKKRAPLSVLAPYLGFAFYAIGSAALTGLGRVGFGSAQAMSPRYITFANLLWITDLALVYVAFALVAPEARRHYRRRFAQIGATLALLLIACSLYGAYRWTERYHYRLEAREVLLTGDDAEMLRRIHPEPDKIIQRRPVLEHYRLSVFRHLPARETGEQPTRLP